MNRTAGAPARYAPALVALHWLLAAAVVLALSMGTLVLSHLPNVSPDKINALRGHMVVGMGIGLMMLVRLVVRLRTPRPLSATAGNGVLEALRKMAHGALYVLVFAMVASGIATSVNAGLPEVVFRGVGALPPNFDELTCRAVHGWVAKGLMAVIALHLAAAIIHQFLLKDRLLSRMWFGK